MSTANPFDLLEDDDNDDLSGLVAKQQQKLVSKKLPAADPTAAPAKRPSKPLPPAQFGEYASRHVWICYVVAFFDALIDVGLLRI